MFSSPQKLRKRIQVQQPETAESRRADCDAIMPGIGAALQHLAPARVTTGYELPVPTRSFPQPIKPIAWTNRERDRVVNDAADRVPIRIRQTASALQQIARDVRGP